MVVNCELHIPLCFQCCPHITVTQSCSLFGLSKGGFFRVTGQQVLGPPFISRSKKPHQGLYIPSGKHTNNYGKSPFFMGKWTISMAIFNSYVKLPEGPRGYWPLEKTPDIYANHLGLCLVCDAVFTTFVCGGCKRLYAPNTKAATAWRIGRHNSTAWKVQQRGRISTSNVLHVNTLL